MRPETRERVERAVRDLLYVPPGRVETAGAIGLLVPEFGNPVFAALAQAMETRATRVGYATILCNTAGSVLREVDYVQMLLERRVEGMVFICAEVTDVRGEHSHYRQLLDRGARIVFVNGSSDALPVTSVGVDERASGRMATEHLLALGHRRIGFAAGMEFAQPTREKLQGRTDALREAGLDPGRHVAHAAFTVEGGRQALRAILERSNGNRPTGVICSNDLMAIGCLQEAASLGLRDPGRPVGRRLRRDRRRDLDAAAADDDRAADRRDRRDRDRRAADADRRAGAGRAELDVPPPPAPGRDDGCAS